MPIRTFGNLKSKTPLAVLRVKGRGAAVIYEPMCLQGKPDRNSKDGHSTKCYPVRFHGPARKSAPCTFGGLYGGASEVMAQVKRHLREGV